MWICLRISLILLLANAAYGLKCYTCTLAIPDGDTETDLACVDRPSEVPGKNVVSCPVRMTYCTIVRNDYKTSGQVSSIERNCAEKPIYLDDDIDSPDLLTHYRACTTDLCNSGNGLDHSFDDDEGSHGGLLIPGTGAASSIIVSNLILIIVMAVGFYNR